VSLRARLLLAFAYVLVIVLVALEVPLALNLGHRADSEVRAQAQGQAQLLAASAAGRLDRRQDLARLVRSAASDLGGRVIVVDDRGSLLEDSAGSGLRSTSYAGRPEVARALAGETYQGTRHSDSLGEDLIVTAVPVVQAGRTAGAVRITQSVDGVQAEVRKDVAALVAIGVVALVLGLAVAWFVAGSLARPLRGLAAAARRVSAGELDERAEVGGSSEQREVATAFNEMTDRLARALRSQREFVANASHQLRTPLTGLRLRLEAAALKTGDPAVERDLRAAEAETERLAKLLGDLLTLAPERECPRGERLSLAVIAAAARERWQGPAESTGHRLRLAGRAEVLVLASRDDLAVMLDNMIENALNYSPPGTTVSLDWGVEGAIAELAVLDEGPGIDAEESARVFERFYRGSAGRDGAPGTGLGLPVVQALAERWGGQASLAGRREGGTRAAVALPAADAARAARLPSLDGMLDQSLPGRG
jgi:two-component system, OmpR family, sensor kinase